MPEACGTTCETNDRRCTLSKTKAGSPRLPITFGNTCGQLKAWLGAWPVLPPAHWQVSQSSLEILDSALVAHKAQSNRVLEVHSPSVWPRSGSRVATCIKITLPGRSLGIWQGDHAHRVSRDRRRDRPVRVLCLRWCSTRVRQPVQGGGVVNSRAVAVV